MSVPTARRPAVGAVLAFITLPAVVAMVEGTTFHLRNRSTHTIVSSGVRREFVLHVPPSYDGSTPTPLVISMHGAGGWGAAQRDISQWNRVADREGFVVVYPSGAAGAGPRIWEVIEGPGLMRDVAFIADLIDTLQAAYNIDAARIYANGLSNGGGMAFVLSCTMSDRIAAVGMVAAAQTLPWEWCSDDRPVPMIAFHGTADSQVPYQGGTHWMHRARWPDVSGWVAKWARRNRCAPDATEAAVAADVGRREYTGCENGAAVVLYTIHGGGHTWPGGTPLPAWFLGATSTSVDASRVMWAFFQEHSRRERANARR